MTPQEELANAVAIINKYGGVLKPGFDHEYHQAMLSFTEVAQEGPNCYEYFDDEHLMDGEKKVMRVVVD